VTSFGDGVSIDGTTAAISNLGYVFDECAPGQWNLTADLRDPNLQWLAGISGVDRGIAVFGDVLTATSQNDLGNCATGINPSAYIPGCTDVGTCLLYERVLNGSWTLQSYMKSWVSKTRDALGYTSAISSDGYVVASSWGESSCAGGIFYNGLGGVGSSCFRSGAVLVFSGIPSSAALRSSSRSACALIGALPSTTTSIGSTATTGSTGSKPKRVSQSPTSLEDTASSEIDGAVIAGIVIICLCVLLGTASVLWVRWRDHGSSKQSVVDS
jgi:hypothetical protein